MMLTRCPACTTTFRVTLEQVKARHGRVRCGRCQNVFDALEHLVDSIATLAPTETGQASTETASIDPEVSPAAASEPVSTTLVEVADVAATPDASDTSSEPAEQVSTPIDEATAPPAAGTEILLAPPQLNPSPLSEGYLRDVEAKRYLRWPWIVGAIIALLILIVQALLFWRVDLATRHPDLRPLLTSLCNVAGCTVGLPSESALLKIETSDLHPAADGQLELVATLHNLAPYAQQWPLLELTLTDATDRAVARRVITPAEYGVKSAEGFPSGSEFAVQIRLDAQTLPAAGYRLYLFYP